MGHLVTGGDSTEMGDVYCLRVRHGGLCLSLEMNLDGWGQRSLKVFRFMATICTSRRLLLDHEAIGSTLVSLQQTQSSMLSSVRRFLWICVIALRWRVAFAGRR